MTISELLCKTNWELIAGHEFSAAERREITDALLCGAAPQSDATPEASTGRDLYPRFFIPSRSTGGRLPTITGILPKTQLLYANHYELEILRLLALWRGDDPQVRAMLEATRTRLRRTCFGRYCATGECFEASIAALRFLSAAFPQEERWITSLMEHLGEGIETPLAGRKRPSSTFLYYWLALAGVDLPVARQEIEWHREDLERCAARLRRASQESGRAFREMATNVLRSCLAKAEGMKVRAPVLLRRAV